MLQCGKTIELHEEKGQHFGGFTFDGKDFYILDKLLNAVYVCDAGGKVVRTHKTKRKFSFITFDPCRNVFVCGVEFLENMFIVSHDFGSEETVRMPKCSSFPVNSIAYSPYDCGLLLTSIGGSCAVSGCGLFREVFKLFGNQMRGAVPFCPLGYAVQMSEPKNEIMFVPQGSLCAAEGI